MKTMQLTPDITYLGTIDADLRTFDVIMHTEYGTTYNAYVLRGSEKTALIETSKARFTDEYLAALASVLDAQPIDYLIVSHTEPDHSGSIEALLAVHPELTIVATHTALDFLAQIVNHPFASLTVKTGDTLSLGNKTLRFFALPNLHWPDTMFTYIEEEKALVTCDVFGAHYAHDGVLRSRVQHERDYQSAVKFYFDSIIAPFKQPFMQRALDAIQPLSIDWILTGHGPVLDTKIPELIAQYQAWCAAPEKSGKTVVMPYVSAYGYTAQLAREVARGIADGGGADVCMHDMIAADPALVSAEMSAADGIVFGTPTMLGDALKPIWDLATAMLPTVFSGKHATAFGSYGWSGEGVPNLLARCKQVRMKVEDEGLRVRFKPSAADLEAAYAFGKAFGGRL